MAGTANSGGRNKKSQAEHALDGTARKDRPSELAPEPPPGRPPMPAGLSGAAHAEWDRMVARLELSKTLTLVDDAALYQYCSLFGETETVQDARRETAALVVTLLAMHADNEEASRMDPDAIVPDVDVAQIVKLKQLELKYTTQLRQGRMALRAYLVEFGMTPSARSRVKLPPAPAAIDPMAEFDETEKPN